MITEYKILKCSLCGGTGYRVPKEDPCVDCEGHGHIVERMLKDEDGIWWDTFMIGELH